MLETAPRGTGSIFEVGRSSLRPPPPTEPATGAAVKPVPQLCHLNYVPLLFTQSASAVQLCARSPPPPPTLNVGSSLRLHFSCLGPLLSSPANKSSANLHPESLSPCTDRSSPPLPGNPNGRRRGGERSGEEGGGGPRVLPKWPSPVHK